MNGLKQKAKTSRQIELCMRTEEQTFLKGNEEWVRLEHAQHEIKELKNKNKEYAKLVAKQAEKYALEIAKLKDLLKNYNDQALAYEKSVEEKLGQIREHTKKLGEILDGQAVWLEMPMTRKVINWREELVGLLEATKVGKRIQN